jgi:acetolactate synthase regulatory subunit
MTYGITKKEPNELAKLLDSHGIQLMEEYRNTGNPTFDTAVKKRMHQYLDLYGEKLAGPDWNPIVQTATGAVYFRDLEPVQRRAFLLSVMEQARHQSVFDVRKAFVKSYRGQDILMQVDKSHTTHVERVARARGVTVKDIQKSAKEGAQSLGIDTFKKSEKVPNLYKLQQGRAIDDDD